MVHHTSFQFELMSVIKELMYVKEHHWFVSFEHSFLDQHIEPKNDLHQQQLKHWLLNIDILYRVIFVEVKNKLLLKIRNEEKKKLNFFVLLCRWAKWSKASRCSSNKSRSWCNIFSGISPPDMYNWKRSTRCKAADRSNAFKIILWFVVLQK